jgi:hypothetical protein
MNQINYFYKYNLIEFEIDASKIYFIKKISLIVYSSYLNLKFKNKKNIIILSKNQNMENKVKTNLEKFLSSYGEFLTENNSIKLDVDQILEDIRENIIDPNTED